MRLLFLLPLLFIFSNLSSQSLTQTDLMDTTIIQAHSNSQSILVIRTSDFTLYLNKKYLIRLVKRSNEAEKRILIRTLRSSDTVTFDCFGSFSEDVIFKCLNKGKFTCVSNESDIVYKTILKVDNFSLVSKELKAKDGSCKRQYLEYLLPDKKTHIIGRTAHITPRIL